MNNVVSKFWVFQLLLYKNFLVRKKQWKLILFVEFLVPLLLFMLIQSGRDLSSEPPKKIDYDTYNDDSKIYQRTKMKNVSMLSSTWFVIQTMNPRVCCPNILSTDLWLISNHLFRSKKFCWVNFEDILVESTLHFPLDFCINMLKDLPRCMDRLEFERGLKLLISVISNAYMKILLMRDIGTQTNDVNSNTKKLLVIVQELIGKFENKR